MRLSPLFLLPYACLSLLAFAHAGALAGGDLNDEATGKKPDKSGYNLFHPTPENLLREFSSSRPDQTTGARSVDAGHFYVETGVAYSLDLGPARTDTWNPLQTRLRVGLTNDIELELIYDGISNRRTREKRIVSTVTGSGALTVRTRLVLLGNDNENFAFSVDPQIVLPTVSQHLGSEYVQGSVVFPVTAKLPAGFSTTINVQPGIARNAADTRYAFQFVSGITLYHNILRKQDRVQLYLEYYDTLTTGSGATDERQVDLGLRWRPWKNFQFDAGCNFGVSAEAPDYQPFAGLVARF